MPALAASSEPSAPFSVQVVAWLRWFDPWMPLLWLLFTALGAARVVQLHGRFRAQARAREALGLAFGPVGGVAPSHGSLAWGHWGAAAGCALLLGGLALALEGGPGHAQLLRWDVTIDHAARHWVQPNHMALLNGLTDTGAVTFMTLLGVLGAAWLVWRKRWLDLQVWLFFSLFNGMLVRVLKLTFDRSRPENLHELVVSGASFPSGHTAGSVLIYGLLTHLLVVRQPKAVRRLCVAAALLWALAIGASRVLLSAHWASDVWAGLALGGMSLLVAVAVLSELRRAQG